MVKNEICEEIPLFTVGKRRELLTFLENSVFYALPVLLLVMITGVVIIH